MGNNTQSGGIVNKNPSKYWAMVWRWGAAGLTCHACFDLYNPKPFTKE
jgi:hypothetical protein